MTPYSTRIVKRTALVVSSKGPTSVRRSWLYPNIRGLETRICSVWINSTKWDHKTMILQLTPRPRHPSLLLRTFKKNHKALDPLKNRWKPTSTASLRKRRDRSLWILKRYPRLLLWSRLSVWKPKSLWKNFHHSKSTKETWLLNPKFLVIHWVHPRMLCKFLVLHNITIRNQPKRRTLPSYLLFSVRVSKETILLSEML